MEIQASSTCSFLPDILNDDKLTVSEISEYVLCMKQKQEIERDYKDKIKVRKNDGRPYVYLNRKQIIASSYSDLIDKLYEMKYGRQNASLKDLYPEWLIWKRDFTSVSSKTLREYTIDWNHYFKDEPLTTVSLKFLRPLDFINLFRKLTKERAMTRKHFNNVKSLLNGIYQYAIETGIVEHNPIKDINCNQFSYKPVNNSDDVFTIEERKKLLNYLSDKDDIYSLAIQLDFQLVLRIGELLSLKWSDISNGNIHIQSQLLTTLEMKDDLTFFPKQHENVEHVKGNTNQGYRYQPLTEEALKILEKIRSLNPDGEYILMKDGKQLTVDTFNRRLKRYCKECDISVHSSHKIRFTVASMLYDAGMPLTTLQQLLGHTTTAMTLHYIRRVTPAKETSDLMNGVLC